MSGGIIIVALGLFERISGTNVPFWVYAPIIVLLVLVASYLAWKEQRQIVLAQQRSDAVPAIVVEIIEAILEAPTYNSLRCFVRIKVRNLIEAAPCMIDNCKLAIRIGEQWYEESTVIGVEGFQLITCDQLSEFDDVPIGIPYKIEDGLPVIETARENITDLRNLIGEANPLRRGFPKSGWIGFVMKNLPNWPTREESVGGGRLELVDLETGEEKWVDEIVMIRITNTVDEISVEVVDGHGQRHSATKSRPFGTWDRRMSARIVSPEK